MSFVSDVFQQISHFTGELAGGDSTMKGVISLWLLGTATYLSRNVPAKLWELIKRYGTTQMTFNNAGHDNAILLYNFMQWLQPRMSESMSRTLSVEVDTTKCLSEFEALVGAGYGTHLFFHKKRLFWLVRSTLESSGSERQKEQITIGTVGRSHQPFKQLVEEFKPKHEPTRLGLFRVDQDGDWLRYARPPKRTFDSIAMDNDLKHRLIGQVQHFKDNREWFDSRGLPYKLSYVLHGQPGTGKTSIIKALASHFNMNICTINIHSMTDNIIEQCFATVPSNSVVIIEDFDSSPATKNREAVSTGHVDSNRSKIGALSLTGILNALDGVNPLDNVILVMTTNHLENVDQAIFRKGRIDYTIEVGQVDPADIEQYVYKLFDQIDLSDIDIIPSKGCFLNEALLESKDDPNIFKQTLIDSGVFVHK